MVGIPWLTPANDRRLGQITRSFFSGPAFRRTFRQAGCQMVSEKQESGTDFGPAAQISQISEICRLRCSYEHIILKA
jgi:hypothetical protein